MNSCRSLIGLSIKNPNRFSLYKTHISSLSLLFFSSLSRKHPVTLTDYLLSRHQFSPETVSKLSSPQKYLGNPEKSDSVLSFLEESGFSRTQLEQVIKRNPRILSANLERTIKPKIKIFQDLGLSPAEIAEIIYANPKILNSSTDNRLGPSLVKIKSVLGTIDKSVFKVLKHSGHILQYDFEKTIIPNMKYLKSCGISSSQMVKYFYNSPSFFLRKPESVKEYVKRVDEIGFDRDSKMFLSALLTIGSMTISTWEQKLELFRSLGFPNDDIGSVFRRKPWVFAISERKIKEFMQTLVNKGCSDISFIIRNPGVLTYSVENRLKPRLQVLELLETKKLLPRKPSLSTVLPMTEKKFFHKFVLPYSNEVGDLYTSLMGATKRTPSYTH